MYSTVGEHFHHHGSTGGIDLSDPSDREVSYQEHQQTHETMGTETDGTSDEDIRQVHSTLYPKFQIGDRNHKEIENMTLEHEDRGNETDIDSLLSHSDDEESGLPEPLRPQRSAGQIDCDLEESENEEEENVECAEHESEMEDWEKGWI